MFCRNCGNSMDAQAVVCVKCGVPVGKGNSFCYNCGQHSDPGAAFCLNCGVNFASAPGAVSNRKSKLAAGLLGIFLGAYGIHNFYLGYTKKAVIQLILTICSCGIGGIWGFVEGILILCGSTITTDASGMPLDN